MIRKIGDVFQAWAAEWWSTGEPFMTELGRGPFSSMLDAAKALMTNHLELLDKNRTP